jgi:hypothetical protein
MSNGMTPEEKAAWEARVRRALDESHQAFVGRYGREVQALLGLSRADIDAITPGTTDLETYDRLIAVVRQASLANASQAELKAKIEALGAIAVSIARKVSGLAALFA